MPLKRGSSQKIKLQNVGHQYADADDLCSSNRVPPMFDCMAIGANCFKIFNIVIFSIFIYMMHLKHKLIFNAASFTTYFTKFFICLSKSFNRIIFYAKRRFMYGRTFSGTILPKTMIHFISANDHFSASNTRISLNAFGRAILSFTAKFIGFKFNIACFACSCFVLRLVRTCSRTIFLGNSTHSVMKFKFCIADKTVAHGGKYAIA